MQKLVTGRASLLLAAVLAAATLAPLSGAHAAGLEPETVLYSFCAQDDIVKGCTDGASPQAGLIIDAAGRLYGTSSGGAYGGGTVFELTPNAAKTKWTHTILYNFCEHGGGCADGGAPKAGLLMDASGHLYGTTAGGGAHGEGTVFELTPNAARTKWTETVLYSFCSLGGNNCTDGQQPRSGVIMDPSGRLYGTTFEGGGVPNYVGYGGTVLELTPNTAKTEWTETVLYRFCSQGGENCTDGFEPQDNLIRDAAGHLYGTTQAGGAHGSKEGGGTVFELAPNAAKSKWTHTILHNFCSQLGCADGGGPVAGLIMDAAGHLYGTTSYGGPPALKSSGTAFELIPNAAKSKWTETVLYGFGSQPSDGINPEAGLIMDSAGRLYGTTAIGASSAYRANVGTVFELTPNSARTKWTEAVLYSFCARSAGGHLCVDGESPYAGLIMDRSGHLYGTTLGGGAHAGGTVFELP
jgi:uncharacterized repeat protein (TIGR03803 family)